MRAKQTMAARMALLAVLAAAPAAAQTWTLTVPAGDGAVQTTNLQRTPANQVTDPTAATVKVTCQNPPDCANLVLRLQNASGATVVDLGRQPQGSNDFLLPASALPAGQTLDLAILLREANGQEQEIDSFPVTSASSGGSGAAAPASSSGAAAPSLADLLTIGCPSTTVTVAYDEAANRGQILVAPTGEVLGRGIDYFDENDTLEVIVYGDRRLLSTLKAERTSSFRDAQTVRIVGAGQTVPSQLQREGALVANCTTQTFTLSDFAPGQGTVTISSYQNDAWVALGTFSFQVNPLYTGILSLGAGRTNLVDPDYKIASNGTEDVVALGDDGEQDVIYTLFYTPYVWGKRDLEKPVCRRGSSGGCKWWKLVNPSFGIVPDDVTDNVLAGVTLDLPAGLLLTYGWHFRRVTVLPADTGLTVGSPFSGTALPTAESWEDDSFFALTIDLRAMVQLFNALGGTSSGGS